MKAALRGFGRLVLALSAAFLAFIVWVYAVPFPVELLRPEPITSTTIVDRDGAWLRDVLTEQDTRARWVSADALPEVLIQATLHAEDKRFFEHGGVDGVAVFRALWGNLVSGEIHSGASTITQQTVKLTLHAGRRRTLATKLMEMVWALRLEAALNKRQILEQYLNRAPYGNQLIGAEAASLRYFGKSAARLSLAEAALLAGVPQSPGIRNPWADLTGSTRRARHILDQMRRRGAITQAQWRRAVDEPVGLAPRHPTPRARHLTDAIASELESVPTRQRPAQVALTLKLEVQSAVEKILATLPGRAADVDRSQVAAVVLDTRTSEVLAWVGSRGFADARAWGANDGVVALRQPGSTLKPFIYGQWLDDGAFAGQVIADLPTQFKTPHGIYAPQNFDRRFHGPVSVRQALASSLNVPAVKVAQEVGVGRVLELLQRAGLSTLTMPAEHYGLGLALGNGEVRLVDLAGAYAALGRLGVWRPVGWRRGRREGNGDMNGGDDGDRDHRDETRRILSPQASFTVLEMLTDDAARTIGFGEAGPLALPFRMAAKTGTSSDFRDNWAVGVTPEYTVAVWVGRFDGRPAGRIRGAVGAPLILRQIAQWLHRPAGGATNAGDVAWFPRPAGVTRVRVCVVNGLPAGPHCPRTRDEWTTAAGLESVRDTPDFTTVAVDIRNGLRAGAGCDPRQTERRAFATIRPALRDHARGAGVPLAPDAWSNQCPPSPAQRQARRAPVRLDHPLDDDRYVLDPAQPQAIQAVTLSATSASDAPVTFWVDGARVATVGPPFRAPWPLSRGRHAVAVGRDVPGPPITIFVR